jgi:hypothetical protein
MPAYDAYPSLKPGGFPAHEQLLRQSRNGAAGAWRMVATSAHAVAAEARAALAALVVGRFGGTPR